MTQGEELVLQLFLEHLPEEWEIYIQPHLNGLRPDFVVLNPASGIGVFEVKDWNLDAMSYYARKVGSGHELMACHEGREFSIQGQNPVTKVGLYKREIFELYCPRLDAKAGWAAITAGVVFPFALTTRVVSLLTPFLPKASAEDEKKANRYQPIAGRDAIASGDISAVFPEASRRWSNIMSKHLADDLRGWLVEPDFSVEQRQPLVLDGNQRALAETRTESGYRRIKGPAGSGKSLVVAARAAKLANEDKKVLIATFNITLWHYLRDMIVRAISAPEKIDNVTFVHFHIWCKRECIRAGLYGDYDTLVQSMNDTNRDNILAEKIPELADIAVGIGDSEKYDAVVVDEGQDYRPLWWNVLRKAVAPGGEVLLVADATQDVYGTANAWTDETMSGAGFSGRWSQLGISYRMPPDALGIARSFAERFLPPDSVDLPNPEQGNLDLFPCHLRWVQCDREGAPRIGANEVVAMMRTSGISTRMANADITILSADMRAGQGIVEELLSRNIRTVDTYGSDHRRKKMGFFKGDARIKATTLHSFKGWETRALIIYVSNAAHPESLALVYAGITRLKRSEMGSWLTVVCSAPELADFGRSFPDHSDA